MPWLPYLHKLSECDTWISFDDVPMESSGFENRQLILGPAGTAQWLTVPVKRGRDLKIRDVLICQDQNWRRKHWRSIELAYGKASQWSQHSDFLRWLYEQEWQRLVDLNEAILNYLALKFELRATRLKLSDMDLTTHKSQLVLDAVKRAGGWHYLFGAMGEDYADLAAFKAAGVEVWIQKYEAKEYPQMRPNVFWPNLWAFDLLLNVELEQARDIMRAGGTVKRLG